jgi:hypothetical protein
VFGHTVPSGISPGEKPIAFSHQPVYLPEFYLPEPLIHRIHEGEVPRIEPTLYQLWEMGRKKELVWYCRNLRRKPDWKNDR